MNIKKFWNLDYKNFDYSLELFKDNDQLDHWKKCGHNLDCTSMSIYQIKNDTTLLDEISTYFPDIENIGVCFHRLDPGHYLPMHEDRYNFYSQKYNVSDLKKIERNIIFLEDSYPGHLLIVEDKVYSKWTSGDVATWRGTTPHSAINLGIVPRYTLQITGIVK